MPDHSLAPPAPPGRPLKGRVEVHAGIILGVRDNRFSRLWEVDAPDLDALRNRLADALMVAYHYTGQELRYPHLLNWWNLYTHWH